MTSLPMPGPMRAGQLWTPVDPHTFLAPNAVLPAPELVFSGPGYHQPKPPGNTVGTVGFVIALVAILFPPLALVSIVCGYVGLAKKNTAAKGLARAAVGISYALIGGAAIILLAMVVVSGW